MDVYGKVDSTYFRASCWSWRPIHAICDFVISQQNLPFDTEYWGSNDGMGLKTQEDCNKLADAIEAHLENIGLKEDEDSIYLCLSCWTTDEGRFLDKSIEDELNQAYPVGTVMNGPVVAKDGTIAYSAHSTSLEHVRRFIEFLRQCGGFEIW